MLVWAASCLASGNTRAKHPESGSQRRPGTVPFLLLRVSASPAVRPHG